MAEMFGGAAVPPESAKQDRRQTERVASDGEQRLAAGEAAGKGKPPRLARWLAVIECRF